MLSVDDLYEWLNSLNDNDDDVECVDLAVLVHKQANDAIKEVSEPYKAVQQDAKAIVTAIIKRTGKTNWNKELQNGNAYVADPYERVTYDSDLLDAYMKHASPEVRTILEMARKVTKVTPSLTIK